MVELLLFGHHECAGLRYGDTHVNLCVMLAAKWWRRSLCFLNRLHSGEDLLTGGCLCNNFLMRIIYHHDVAREEVVSEYRKPSTLERFIPIVDFLGAFLGADCEVVLHDATRPDSSVLAIANSHISGRRVGSPITDMALRLIKDGTWMTAPFITGYKTQSKDGRQLHSATYFIREDDGSLAGMLCLNMDAAPLIEARDLLDRFISRARMEKPRSDAENGHPLETFAESLEDLTSSIIQQAVNGADIPPDRMTADEKIAIVRTLNEKGVFLLKGAVAVVARHLAASEATVYRYLQRVSS